MKRLNERLVRLERQREASKPIPPCLVLLPSHDAEARLAEFRRVHGCEPGHVFTIKRAPPKP